MIPSGPWSATPLDVDRDHVAVAPNGEASTAVVPTDTASISPSHRSASDAMRTQRPPGAASLVTDVTLPLRERGM
jgi:hypothetical protein